MRSSAGGSKVKPDVMWTLRAEMIASQFSKESILEIKTLKTDSRGRGLIWEL